MSTQILQESQVAGQQMLDKAINQSNTVLPRTSHPGQQIIQKQLALLEEALTLLLDEMVQSREELEAILEAWDKHDVMMKQFADWLTDAEEKGKALEELQPHLQGKKTQLANAKVGDCYVVVLQDYF